MIGLMMKTMKRLLFFLGVCSAFAFGADLAAVHTVYLLPMSRGLDQYLANRLTSEHVFLIVTDPKLADAVLTDRIGESFESQYDNLYPKPEPPKPAKPDTKDGKKLDDERPTMLATDTVNKSSNPALNSSFGRGRGTVFLVDVKSRQVVWSAYEPQKGGMLSDADRTASGIVARLKKDLNPPKTKEK